MATSKKKKQSSFQTLWKTFVGDSRSSDLSLSFFAYVMILLVVGLVMMSSASYAWAYSEHDGDGLFYAKSQLKNAVIGFAALIFFMKMDYHNLKNIKLPILKKFNIAGLLYVIGAVLLIVVLIIGSDEGGTMGAKRWLALGPISFQPSEVAKLAIIVFFAYSMEKDGKNMNKFSVGIVKYAVLMGVYAVLLFMQPHLYCPCCNNFRCHDTLRRCESKAVPCSRNFCSCRCCYRNPCSGKYSRKLRCRENEIMAGSFCRCP